MSTAPITKGTPVTVDSESGTYSGHVESYSQCNEYGDVAYQVWIPSMGRAVTVASDRIAKA